MKIKGTTYSKEITELETKWNVGLITLPVNLKTRFIMSQLINIKLINCTTYTLSDKQLNRLNNSNKQVLSFNSNRVLILNGGTLGIIENNKYTKLIKLF